MIEPTQLVLDRATAHWQWAFDAADRALAADRLVLRDGALGAEARRLAAERQRTMTLLRRLAHSYSAEPPWLAASPVTPRRLGLPAGAVACVFDLEGVLTDSDALHAAAWAAALDPVLASSATLRFAPFDPVADYDAYFDGRPRLEGIRLFLAGRGLHLSEASVDEIARHKGALIAHGLAARGVAARRGAHRYLQAAAHAHLRCAVVSASTATSPMLQIAGLAHLVDVAVDAETMRAGGLRARPAPDILVRACAELGADPGRCVSLTHSGAGVVAAAAAGMPAIGVSGGEDPDELRAYGTEQVVDSVALLLEPALRED